MENNLGFDILGIDLGTYNVKTSSGFLCRSIFTENTKFNINSKGHVILDDKKYLIGAGKTNTEIIKAKRYTMPLYLYAIAKSTSADKVKVVLSLPKYQLDNDEYVKDIKKQHIGNFKFMCDGFERNIEVLDVTIFPEGMGAYYTITKDLSDKEVVVIDIGGSTFNIMWFVNGDLIKAKTLPFGSINLLTDIMQHTMSIHGGRQDIEKISRYVQRGRYGKTDDTMPYITELAESYIGELQSMLELEFPTESAEYFLTGGGVEVFADCIIKHFGDVGLIADYVFANANGNEIIGEAIYNG